MGVCLLRRGETTSTPLVCPPFFPPPRLLPHASCLGGSDTTPNFVLDGLARIVRDEGVLSLWKGWSPNVNRAMFMTASQLATYDQFKEVLLASGYFKDNLTTHFTASLLAGLVATTVCSPFDVIKTRVMNDKTGEYRGTLDCFLKIFRAEGPIAFFKGWTPSYTRLGPHTILTFVFLEQMKLFYFQYAK